MVEQKSETIRAGSKSFFIDLKETKEGKPFLVITESRFKGEGEEHERISIAVFPEYAEAFLDALQELIPKLEV